MPVILMTGWGDQLDRAKMKESGADLVLAKPFDKTQILHLIADMLARKE